MNEIIETLERWQAQGERVAMATVIRVSGSAPRSEGAKMLVTDRDKIAGSVSGGCVEGAVAREAQAVLASGTPVVASYGINKNMMWDVGLSCGGKIDVFIEPAAYPRAAIERTRFSGRFAVCTIVRGPDRVGAKLVVEAAEPIGARLDGTPGTGDASLDAAIARVALGPLQRGLPETVSVGAHEVFVDVVTAQPRLILVGAVHIAAALCGFASAAGFDVIVVDPRPALNNRERFPLARDLIVGWPEDELDALHLDEDTYVAVLTHDEKFDDPTLMHALRTKAAYIGAIGSKKTQALRRQRLLDAGYAERDVDRVHAPIGLDIGAQSPEEIAIAILAEAIMTKYGHRGAPLRDKEGSKVH